MPRSQGPISMAATPRQRLRGRTWALITMINNNDNNNI